LKRSSAFSLLVLLTVSVLLIGCGDDITSVGVGFVEDPIGSKIYDTRTDTITILSYSYPVSRPLGAATNVLIGKIPEAEASALLNFLTPLPDTVKNELLRNKITVVSARLLLTNRALEYGDTALPFNATNVEAFKVLEDYEPSTATLDSLPRYETGVNRLRNPRTSDTLVTFDVDESLITEWIKAEVDTTLPDNFGIYLKPNGNTNKIQSFQGYATTNEENPPKIEIRFSNGSTLDTTITFRTLNDVHFIKSTFASPGDDRFLIGSGAPTHAALYIDLSKLPKDAIINKAQLYLQLDTINSKYSPNSNIGANIYAITAGSVSGGDKTFERDSIYTSRLSLSSGAFSGTATRIISTAFAENNNKGLLIEPISAIEGYDRFLLYGAKASRDKLPRLVITYTTKEVK